MQEIHDIGCRLGFKINAKKTKMHHWSSKPPEQALIFQDVTLAVLPAVAHFLGHTLAHSSLRLSLDQDMVQTVAADL